LQRYGSLRRLPAVTYSPPQIEELGSLSELTQNVLPSARAATGTMAALSPPMTTGGGGGGETVAANAATAETSSPSTAPGVLAGDEGPASDRGGDAPGAAAGESGQGAPGEVAAATAGEPQPAASGELPFTGFLAGAVGAAGAAIAGAGVALRRAARRR
jgi:hypothetical protein